MINLTQPWVQNMFTLSIFCHFFIIFFPTNSLGHCNAAWILHVNSASLLAIKAEAPSLDWHLQRKGCKVSTDTTHSTLAADRRNCFKRFWFICHFHLGNNTSGSAKTFRKIICKGIQNYGDVSDKLLDHPRPCRKSICFSTKSICSKEKPEITEQQHSSLGMCINIQYLHSKNLAWALSVDYLASIVGSLIIMFLEPAALKDILLFKKRDFSSLELNDISMDFKFCLLSAGSHGKPQFEIKLDN